MIYIIFEEHLVNCTVQHFSFIECVSACKRKTEVEAVKDDSCWCAWQSGGTGCHGVWIIWLWCFSAIYQTACKQWVSRKGEIRDDTASPENTLKLSVFLNSPHIITDFKNISSYYIIYCPHFGLSFPVSLNLMSSPFFSP